MIRKKLDQQEMARCSRISRKYPGMSYEEIASSRSGGSKKKPEPEKVEVVASPGKESVESVENPQEKKEAKEQEFEKHKVVERNNDGTYPKTEYSKTDKSFLPNFLFSFHHSHAKFLSYGYFLNVF